MINYIIKIVLIASMISSLAPQRESRADDGYMEAINGADRDFTYGYSQAEKVRRFDQNIEDRNMKEGGEKVPPAAEGDGLPWRFSKSFRVSTLYDSNLFYSRTDTKDDVLFIYSPSVGASIGTPNESRFFLRAFYDLNYVDYVEMQKFSRFNQALRFQAGLHQPKFDLIFSNVFKPASARETGERTELAASNNSRVIAHSDGASLSGNYHLTPKVDLTASYNFNLLIFPVASNRNNPGVNLFSYQQNSISPGIEYKYSPKTTFYFNSTAGMTDYFEGGNLSSKNYGVLAGLRNRLTPKTDVTLEAGYGWTDYLTGGIPGLEGPRYGAILRRQLSPKISATLSASQSVNEAFDFTQLSSEADTFKVVSTILRTDVKWNVNEPMLVEAFVSAQDNTRDSLYTMTDPENDTLTFTRSLEDHVYTWGLNCQWRTKGSWTYFASAESVTKFSSFKNLQYDEQKIAGSLRMDF